MRHAPLPAATDSYLAADQLLDEMLGSLRQHYAEDAQHVVYQKCNGMELKLRVNKQAEAEGFYEACKQNVHLFTEDSTKSLIRKRLETFRKMADGVD